MAIPVKLSYTQQGKGTAVVLLHGFPFSGAIWRDQVKGLSDDYQIIVPDLRGHGTSPALDGVYTMEVLAGDVLALLDELNIQKCVLIGHSMGGYVTLAAWKLTPERFLALGLIDSQAGADDEKTRQGRLNLADRVEQGGAAVVADAMLPKLFASELASDDFSSEQARTIIVGTHPTGIVGALKGMAARPDLTALLPDISVPVLLLTGDQDATIETYHAERMSTAIPNAMLISVQDAGHMPMLEQPTATTEAIRRFLQEAVPGEETRHALEPL